jgi:hypothetical protein
VTARGYGVARSPLEVLGIALALAVVVGVGLLWGTGVIIGSIFGSVLPGSGGEGVAAILGSFPDVGRAWEPGIPSGLVWGTTVLVAAVFAPLVWRLIRAGHLADEGAQWAGPRELRLAGLLVADRSLPNAEEEEPSDAS